MSPITEKLPPNPKQAFGDLKPNLSLIPGAFLVYTALALENGAKKYGPFNWREKAVEAMTYIAANARHMEAWKDREELAPDSLLPHLGHAAASIAILVDCLTIGNLIDNRPPAGAVSRLVEEIAAQRKVEREAEAAAPPAEEAPAPTAECTCALGQCTKRALPHQFAATGRTCRRQREYIAYRLAVARP